MKKIIKDIYLDSAANTPVDKEVFSAMRPYMTGGFVGNSHSIHKRGVAASQVVENARQSMAVCLGVQPGEIFFTSGATEANNWVIKALALRELSLPENKRKNHILCSTVEHSSVLNTCKSLQNLGFNVEFFNCDSTGKLTVKNIRGKVTPKTLLVCALAVNNETGVVNDIEDIAHYVYKTNKETRVLCDSTQLIPLGRKGIKKSFDLARLYPHVDFFTFSAHKIYGPEGVGCLVARSDTKLPALLNGGAQEQGKRGGTHNLPGIVGMAKALQLVVNNSLSEHYYSLYNYAYMCIMELNEKYGLSIKINGKPSSYHIMNINCSSIGTFADLSSTLASRGIDCSPGAACGEEETDDEIPASHVLLAMGLSKEEAHASVRISFSKYNTTQDIKTLFKILENIIKERKKND